MRAAVGRRNSGDEYRIRSSSRNCALLAAMSWLLGFRSCAGRVYHAGSGSVPGSVLRLDATALRAPSHEACLGGMNQPNSCRCAAGQAFICNSPSRFKLQAARNKNGARSWTDARQQYVAGGC